MSGIDGLGFNALNFDAIRSGYNPPGVSNSILSEFRSSSSILEETAEKLSKLTIRTLHANPTITGNLEEKDIPPEVTSHRHLITKIYNHLKETDQLALLSKPTQELFEYKGRHFTVHPALQALAEEYMRNASLGQNTFAVPLAYAQTLKDRRISDLERFALEKNEERYKRLANFEKKDIQKKYETYLNSLRIMERPSSSFSAGDFRFISDECTRRLLSNAYKVITEENKWESFTIDYPKTDFAFLEACRAHGLSSAMKKIDDLDNHSHISMFLVMQHMHHLKLVGWDQFVREFLENASNQQ